MLKILLSVGIFGLAAVAAGQTEIELASINNSSLELDAIIQDEAKDIVYVPAERPKPDFDVQDRRSFQKEGHSITYNRVAPPVISSDEAVFKAPKAGPVVDFSQFFSSQKPLKHFHFFGTVMDRDVTELSWYLDGKKFQVLVNADLSFLHTMSNFENDDSRFSIFGMMGRGPTSEEVETVLSRKPFIEGVPIQYIVLAPEDVSDEDLAHENFEALDALLGHYEANKQSLWQSFVSQQAKGKAYRDYKEANPPDPNIEINFWKIEN